MNIESSNATSSQKKSEQPMRHRINLIYCCADGHDGCGCVLPLKYFEYYCSFGHANCGNSGLREVPIENICDDNCKECK